MAEQLACPSCGAAPAEVREVVEGRVWSMHCSSSRVDHNVSVMSWASAEHCAELWNRRAALASPAVVVSAEPVAEVSAAMGYLSELLAGLLDEAEWAEAEARIAVICGALATPVGPDAVDARDEPLLQKAFMALGLMLSYHGQGTSDYADVAQVRAQEVYDAIDAALAYTPSKGAA